MKEKKLWSETELLDFKNRWKAVTIPVNIQIENKQIALDLTRTNRIIVQAEKIALGDCICRVTIGNCTMPQNTCLFLNERAETRVENERAKFITKEEAKTIVSETHEKGLVHMALHPSNEIVQFPSEICSCCSCCCQALQGLLVMNINGVVEPSEFVTTFDLDKCNQCCKCVERCQFGARTIDSENKIIYNQDLCFGCGLCVTNCPEKIINLIPR